MADTVYAAFHEVDLRMPKSTPLYFHHNHFESEADIEPHTHPWGRTSRTGLGLMEVVVDGRRPTVPAKYAIWTPASQLHLVSIR